MISGVCVGTNDLPAAQEFYDSVLSTLGMDRLVTVENEIGYGIGGDANFWVLTPYNADQYKLLFMSWPLPNLAGTGTIPWLTLSHSATKTWMVFTELGSCDTPVKNDKQKIQSKYRFIDLER